MPSPARSLCLLILLTAFASAQADLKTWDGKHSIDQIDLTLVYFLPRDRTALPDWQDRVNYFRQRIQKFHEREFEGQSKLTIHVPSKPFQSSRTTEQLRSGDADFIFFQTLREVNDTLNFGPGERKGFPILLVLSDINWRSLDDFYRLKPGEEGPVFEGQLIQEQHFPGATAGGARATYLSREGKGWGLVSADGWRVPYRGSDCVAYHEGMGHTVGLPHPKDGNGSVMSLGQYKGWLSESWLDADQKERLGFNLAEGNDTRQRDLYSVFRALPDPKIPKPGESVSLTLDWPQDAEVSECRVRIQTDLWGSWVTIPQGPFSAPPQKLELGKFDRPTPVSYRVDAKLKNGEEVELWGYFQVRSEPDKNPEPPPPLIAETNSGPLPSKFEKEIDLLALIHPANDQIQGEWELANGKLTSPRMYGSRIEIPYQPPEEYQLTVIAEPLDDPNGLILGQRSGENRFLVLVNYDRERRIASALENIDGRNVDNNLTTVHGAFLKKNRPSLVQCTVQKDSVTVSVDGREIIHWKGESSRLSLGDYWATPRENTLFLGAYDCRYVFHRVGLVPLTGSGKVLEREGAKERVPNLP